MRHTTRSQPTRQVPDRVPTGSSLELIETDDPEVMEVVSLCRAFIDDLGRLAGRAVGNARFRVLGGRVGLAVVVAEEMVSLARSLALKYPGLSVFAIVNVAGGAPGVAPLTDEEREFLDYLIEGALASWMLET